LRKLFSDPGNAQMYALPGKVLTSSRTAGTWGVAMAALETMRPHQWLKNALVLLPLLAAHRFTDVGLLVAAAITFLAFSLTASAVYITNDVHDARADADHPHKMARPIPSGRLPLAVAWALVPSLLVPALALGWWVNARVALVLITYFLLMIAYSWLLRRVVLLDALVLAAGYALRVVAGGVAVAILPSPRLVAFCIFLFFSLALLKRYAELALLQLRDGAAAHARSYSERDVPPVLAIGTASGVMSALVLALYVSSAAAGRLNTHPDVIWATCILLLYWISHLWLSAHRGSMTDDPLVFAVKDRLSLTLIVLMGATAWLAL
jgi:4-hydroxybenzoate polyprenyltransferase